VVLIARDKNNLQRHIGALGNFCKHSGLQVNISKTRVMIIGTRVKTGKSFLNDRKMKSLIINVMCISKRELYVG
jgi:hypothetical protein